MSSPRSPSSSIQPPPIPTAPRPRRSAGTGREEACPSHAQFLLDQTRTSLAHLHKSGVLDALTYRDVELKLSRAVLKDSRDTSVDKGRGEEEEEVAPGKRNAMVRKAMVETDLLPSMVEAALNVVGGPFLGGSQIDAIVELVSLSQEKIAETVTNPRKQRAASSSAFAGLKGVHTGVTRGVAAANSSFAELNRRREESRLKAEKKKAEKRERKAMKDELKRERAEIQERRAAQAAKAAASAGQADTIHAGASTTSSQATSEATPSEVSFSSSDEGDDGLVTPKSAKASGSSSMGAVLGQTVQEGPATANVACTRLGTASSAAVTTFVPWAGIMISSTIVASPIKVEDVSEAATATSLSPPPRRVPPSVATQGSLGPSLNATREDSTGSSMKMVASPSSISASSLQLSRPTDLAGSGSCTVSTSMSGPRQDGGPPSSADPSAALVQPDEARLLARQPPPLPPHPSRALSSMPSPPAQYDAGLNAAAVRDAKSSLSESRPPARSARTSAAESAGSERPDGRQVPPPSAQGPPSEDDGGLVDVTDRKRKGLESKFMW